MRTAVARGLEAPGRCETKASGAVPGAFFMRGCRALLLAPLLFALAACQSPMERCVAQATESLRAAERELASAEATLARGHALETRRRSIPIYTSCRAGDGRVYPCFRDWEQEVTV